MNALLQDLRYAIRTLAKSRTYTLIAVLCLGLGIGVNSAIFTVVNAILLRPFPFAAPEQVVTFQATHPTRGIDEAPLSAPDWIDWTSSASTLAGVAAIDYDIFAVSARGEEAERVEGLRVTPNLFALLGIAPAVGRDFHADEGRLGGPGVVVLSHALWERRYGGDATIFGRTLDLDGVPHTIVGVMPSGMKFPETAQLWVAFTPDAARGRGDRHIYGIGRLAPGVTAAQAQAEFDAVAQRIAAEHPRTHAGWRAQVMTFQDYMVDGPLRLLLVLMLGAVGCVLLIACANVANLLLARAAARRRELAVRVALGASRGHIIRQLLAESVVVALIGGALGLLVAMWWNDLLFASIPEELPFWMRVEVDGTVLAYTFALSVATGLLFGILPALHASRTDLQHVLKDGGRGVSHGAGGRRLRGALVSGQIALSMVLLMGAALMMRSFLEVARADAGFDTRPILTARAYLTGSRYDDPRERAAYFTTAVERLEALPGVAAAAATSAIPIDDGGPAVPLVLEGQAVLPGEEMVVTLYASTPGLFDALDQPLRAGRSFTAQEATDSLATAVIVNQRLAAQLWPGADPLGRRLRLPTVDSTALFTVVGVANDLVYEELGEQTPQSMRQVYLPYGRDPSPLMAFVLRAEGAPAPLAAGLRETLQALDPTLPTFDVRTMDEVRRYTSWQYPLFGQVFTTFGVLALVLAAVGLYGVMAYTVAQRGHELGVRMALGAQPRAVQLLVVRDGLRMAAIGLLVGLVAAVVVTRAMRGLLFGVGPADPLSFLVVAPVLTLAALLACWLPARRATRIDPLLALRSE